MMPALLCLLLAAGEPVSESARTTVTVPLHDALRLLTPVREEAPAPPVSAAVVSQRLKGRVNGETLEVTASFTVTVLDGSRWSRLRLLKLSPGVTLVDASRVEGGLVAVRDQEIVMVAKSVGTSTVELKLSARASGGALKTARLWRGADALDGVMRLEADGELDVLEGGSEVSSDSGCWTVSWRAQARAKAQVVVARPPMEPQIAAVGAKVVSTMEGKVRLTVEYVLELDREQPLAVALPEGWNLTRLSLNEVPQRLGHPQKTLALTVGPSRPGEHQGAVALTLERDFGVFHLSGRLAFELPQVSWPTKVIEVIAHLPAVFEYRRVGGSLEPMESKEEAPEADGDSLEAPGKRLSFRQYLVSSVAPTLELKYSVDLDHRYFSLRSGR